MDTETIKTRTTENLRFLGFGVHESLVIIALNQMASGTVADLSVKTGIHHANLYSILEGLEGRGLAVCNNGRPRIYQFAPLAHLEDFLSTKLNQLMADLKHLQEDRETTGASPALIYTIRGRSDVQSKMLSMISQSTEKIILTGPNLEDLGVTIIDALKSASERDVEIRCIVAEPIKDPGFKLHSKIKDDSLAVNLVVDGLEAVIAMPDLSVCGWTDNPLISLQLEGFLEQNWKLARTK
ncbi:MAG: TrmB family transcriptional regulator [Candidatus Thorarchaeota archaeon]